MTLSCLMFLSLSSVLSEVSGNIFKTKLSYLPSVLTQEGPEVATGSWH